LIKIVEGLAIGSTI